MKSRIWTEEQREKIRESNRRRRGWHHTDASKAKSRQAHLGVPKPAGFQEKMRKLRTGFKHSPESLLKMSQQQSLAGNARWKGGRHIAKTGYVWIKNKTHPHRKAGDYVLEHRLVMEKFLGRYLNPEEVVHHINGVRDDNRLENLVLFPDQAAHRTHHCGLQKA